MSICFICLWLLVFALKQFVGDIEFVNRSWNFVFRGIYFAGLPTALMLTLTGSIKQSDSTLLIAVKTILTLFISVAFLLVMAFFSMVNYCDWTTDSVLLLNKQNPDIKIVSRSYQCGEIRRKSPPTLVVEVHEYLGMLVLMSDIDLQQINENEWDANKK